LENEIRVLSKINKSKKPKSAVECGTNACCGLYRTKPDFKKTK